MRSAAASSRTFRDRIWTPPVSPSVASAPISSASEGGKNLFSLTDAGRQEADAGPEAPWEEASRGVDWEALGEIRQAGFGLMEAFGQVWKTGTKEQREKALAVIGEARKKLYLILADED